MIVTWLLVGLVYAFMAGMTAAYLVRRHSNSCNGCGEYNDCTGQQIFRVLAGAFWIIGIPLGVGVLVGLHDSGSRKEAQVEAARKAEIEAKKHLAEVARLEADEAESLSRRLRALGKES